MRRIAAALLLAGMAGCSGDGKTKSDADPPASAMTDRADSVSVRVRAIEGCWEDVDAGTTDRASVRAMLKQIVWTDADPVDVRVAAARALMKDTTPEGLADTETFISLRLPTERSLQVVAVLCDACVAHDWVDVTSSIVRSFSRPVDGVADANRPEGKALLALHPDSTLPKIVFAEFVDPGVDNGDAGFDRRERARADAWGLLGRIDPSGDSRAELVLGLADPVEPTVRHVRLGLEELRVLPLTGEELMWLDQLAASRADGPDGWWAQAGAAVSTLTADQRRGLRLRHLEPIRWCAANRTEWMTEDWSGLWTIALDRDEKQRHHRRSTTDSWTGPTRDRLGEWKDTWVWADLLTILMVRDVLDEQQVVTMLFGQAVIDHGDDTTEYGGLILQERSGQFFARLYPPRPATRHGDYMFVASQDMIDQGAFSLSDYHFHVQDWRNAEYAGPSDGDMEYAATHGRTCLVFTSIRESILGVDLYQPDGAIADLGEVRK